MLSFRITFIGNILKKYIKELTCCFVSKNVRNMIVPDDLEMVMLDVFDTIICRRVHSPEDIFDLVQDSYERNYNWNHEQSFKVMRINAEKEARKIKKAEVNYDDIYNNLNTLSEKEKEVLLLLEKRIELDQSFFNIEFNALIKDLKRRQIEIVLVSDTYMSTEEVCAILRKCNVNFYKRIYISSELNMTKRQGNLFMQVMKDESVDKSKILHIGDDLIRDYIIPRNMGIKAILCKKCKCLI
jgi:predicted HAD superfamily hydrolase